MSDAFGRALQAITDDSEAAFLFSQGDFSSLGEADLTEREQQLLTAAAEDADEVAGFQFRPEDPPSAFMKLGDIKEAVRPERFREALEYYQYQLEN